MSDAGSPSLLIDLRGRERFAPGDAVEVAIGWDLPEPPEQLVLELVWATRGRGRTDAAAALRRTWSGGLAAAGAEVVSWTMPVGPLTHEGVLVSIGWKFRLRGPGKRRARRPVVLARPEPS